MSRRIRAVAAYLAAFCLAGETTDKTVTLWGFGVILFFVLVVTIGTIIQSSLERRKEQAKAARMRQRTGW